MSMNEPTKRPTLGFISCTATEIYLEMIALTKWVSFDFFLATRTHNPQRFVVIFLFRAFFANDLRFCKRHVLRRM